MSLLLLRSCCATRSVTDRFYQDVLFFPTGCGLIQLAFNSEIATSQQLWFQSFPDFLQRAYRGHGWKWAMAKGHAMALVQH